MTCSLALSLTSANLYHGLVGHAHTLELQTSTVLNSNFFLLADELKQVK